MRFLAAFFFAVVFVARVSSGVAIAQAPGRAVTSHTTAEIEAILGGGTPVGTFGLAVGWLPTEWLILAVGVGASGHSNPNSNPEDPSFINAFNVAQFDLQVSVMARTRFAPQGFSLNPGLGVSVGRYDAWRTVSDGSGDPGPGPTIEGVTIGAEAWGNGEISLDYRYDHIVFRAFVGAAIPLGGGPSEHWCVRDFIMSGCDGSLGASVLPYAGLALGGEI